MSDLKRDVLPKALHILMRRCGQLTSISGQGIMRGERNQFLQNGKLRSCIVKTSTHGRISFGKGNGKWIGLEDSDFVVVVGPTAAHDPTRMVSMFEKSAMKAAFDANQAAQEKAGKGHLPNWIAPFHEEGRGARGAGDGFQGKALWTEPLDPKPGVPMSIAEGVLPESSPGLTIEQAKQGLAKTFGVPPESVEITIRG